MAYRDPTHPHTQTHNLQDWRFLCILAACLIGFHGMTAMYYTLNSNTNNQQNREASSRPLEPNTHMHVNLQTTAMCDLLWCAVASQDIIVQCSEKKKLKIYRVLCVITLSVSGRQTPLFPNLISLVLEEIHRDTSTISLCFIIWVAIFFFWPGGKDEWHEIQRIRHELL